MYGFGQFCRNGALWGNNNYGGYIMVGIGLILILVIVYLLFKKGTFTSVDDKNETALEILQKRFVNGEINEDEYLSKKEILGKIK